MSDIDRQEWVDVAKGIGIILVVYGHVARGLESSGIYKDGPSFQSIDAIIYSFHMPLFFFLAGLFLKKSLENKTATEFAANKSETILYPYIVWSIGQGLIEWVASRYTNGNITLAEVFSFAWGPRAQFWFLYVLYFLFLLSAFAASKIKIAQWGYILISVCSFAGAGLADSSTLLHKTLWSGGFFFIGVALNQTTSRLNQLTAPLTAGLWLLCIFSHVYLILITEDGSAQPWLLYLAGISITTICLTSMKLTGHAKRILSYLGKNSMQIYLAHILAGSGIRIILKQAFEINDATIHLVAGTTAGVVAPLLLTIPPLNKYSKILFKSPIQEKSSASKIDHQHNS